MPSNTTHLNLYKVDTVTDGSNTFNINTILNDNWDKVDTAVNALLESNDAMVFKGIIDCSGNPNYPAANAGHVYKISVAGKIGGASGAVVEAGDVFGK